MFWFIIFLLFILVSIGITLIPNLIDEPRDKKPFFDSPFKMVLFVILVVLAIFLYSVIVKVDAGFRF